MWMNLQDIMLRERVTKDQILYDFTYINYLKYSHSQKQTEWLLPGSRGKEKEEFNKVAVCRVTLVEFPLCIRHLLYNVMLIANNTALYN